jgi:hypothetical protein
MGVAARSSPTPAGLVPSVTELLCDLGLADQLVGRTGFCIHPWETVRHIPKLGGTKQVSSTSCGPCAPATSSLSIDENRRETAEALAQFVPHVVVTHPRAPCDNLELYRLLGAIFGREREAEGLCRSFERAYARAAAITRAPRYVLYLIWREPWMTVASDTYISRMLAVFNWHTRPAAPSERYPEIELAAFAGQVDHTTSRSATSQRSRPPSTAPACRSSTVR